MAAPGPPILIVEDEPDLAEVLAGYLRRAGHTTAWAHDGISALERFFHDRPALVLLDLMLPRLSGQQVLRAIREAEPPLNAVPVIGLTARGGEADRLGLFGLGADDYVVKPYWPREVMARVDAVLRRSAPMGREAVLLGARGLRVDLARRTVSRDGHALSLRPAEFDLLVALLAARGRVFRRAELLEVVRAGESWAQERTVDSHVTRLRARLGELHGIETVHGVGYRYAD